MLAYEACVGKFIFKNRRDMHLTVTKTPYSIFVFTSDFLPYEIYMIEQMQDKYLLDWV